MCAKTQGSLCVILMSFACVAGGKPYTMDGVVFSSFQHKAEGRLCIGEPEAQ